MRAGTRQFWKENVWKLFSRRTSGVNLIKLSKITCVYIHYTANIVLANSFFWPEYTFKYRINVGCGTWKRRLFAIAVRVTGKQHQILFSSIQHLAWLPQGRPQGKQKCGKNSDFWITRKLLKIDRYMLRGVWQALNCLSIDATYCMIVAGASPGETKM